MKLRFGRRWFTWGSDGRLWFDLGIGSEDFGFFQVETLVLNEIVLPEKMNQPDSRNFFVMWSARDGNHTYLHSTKLIFTNYNHSSNICWDQSRKLKFNSKNLISKKNFLKILFIYTIGKTWTFNFKCDKNWILFKNLKGKIMQEMIILTRRI